MVEVLPLKVLSDEDGLIFGSEAIALGKLLRLGISSGAGIAVSAPNLKLKTILEQYNFSTREIFEQSLTLVKKEISKTPVPSNLEKELGKHKKFIFKRKLFKTKKDLWLGLMHAWIEQIKSRLWRQGFYPGVTEGLETQIVSFANNVSAAGEAYFDSLQDDVLIHTFAGKIHPADQKKLVEMVTLSNKKLLLPNLYEWVYDKGLKIIGLKPFTPTLEHISTPKPHVGGPNDMYMLDTYGLGKRAKSAVKVFFDLSSDLTIEKDVDGVFIASEKIFDLNKPRESFENLVFRLVESAITFPDSKVLFKLADESEGLPDARLPAGQGSQGMGKVRGALRLIHQKSLFDPIVEAVLFARNKKNLKNVHIVIPFVRSQTELMQIKRELAVKKLIRKSSLELWMEVCTPENIVNLEDYLNVGIDGVVLNTTELIAYLNGFDHTQEDLVFYKNEVKGLLKFLEDSLKILHKVKVPFIVTGFLTFYPEVLEFLIEKGVYGVVVEKYEAPSARDFLHQAEKKMILKVKQ